MRKPRRRFIRQLGLTGLGLLGASQGVNLGFAENHGKAARIKDYPLVISTWDHGLAANQKAFAILNQRGRALDAVEKGVNVSENDPQVMSVGYGGRPDMTGKVTLDSCIMDETGNAGAVGFIQGIKNPVSVARKVMEETRHVFLVGSGAEEFAAQQGFKKENLLTDEAEKQWLKWKADQQKKSDPNTGHDTIGLLAIDVQGNLSGACTTSGLAYKIHGRVGDSPIIGAGLYVDNQVGAAAATGVGEECIKICGSFLIVENMRRGASPEEACFDALKRVAQRHPAQPGFQLAFVALNISGETGAASLIPGFEYALKTRETEALIPSKYLIG